MPLPRPATEARSGILVPGRPSRARPDQPIRASPAGWPHTPAADRMYATDVRQTDRQTSDRRQTASSLNASWAGHNK